MPPPDNLIPKPPERKPSTAGLNNRSFSQVSASPMTQQTIWQEKMAEAAALLKDGPLLKSRGTSFIDQPKKRASLRAASVSTPERDPHPLSLPRPSTPLSSRRRKIYEAVLKKLQKTNASKPDGQQSDSSILELLAKLALPPPTPEPTQSSQNLTQTTTGSSAQTTSRPCPTPPIQYNRFASFAGHVQDKHNAARLAGGSVELKRTAKQAVLQALELGPFRPKTSKPFRAQTPRNKPGRSL